MFKRSQFAISLACLLWAFSAQCALAQSPTDSPGQPLVVTAACSSEFVRFTAPAKVYEMRLEVFAADGQALYDSDFKFGNLLDWGLHDQQGQRLADGAYRCVITVRALSGRLSRRQGAVLLQDSQPTLQVGQSPQSIRPLNPLAMINTGDFLALPNKETPLPLTALGHDGQQGRLVSGSGGLSFRLGDFFAGKDIEHMRLTTEGKLGIGIENPQAKLDVAGLIRTSEGLLFPDGTVQTTAYLAAGRSISEHAGMQPDVQERTVTEASKSVTSKKNLRLAPNGTVNKVAKFAADGTSLIDSTIIDTGTRVGIGTLNPVSNLHLVMGTSSLSAANGTTGYFYFNGPNVSDYTGFLVQGVAVSDMFFGRAANTDDLIIATANTWNPAERVRFKQNGKVGIGIFNPAHQLDVNNSGASATAAVHGKTSSSSSYGVFGESMANNSYGVYGYANTTPGQAGYGVYGQAKGSGYGVFGNLTEPDGGWAGYFNGKVTITGPLDKPAGSFKIDHPLDPANKYLYHSFVESPDMMNIYNGNVTTDDNGEATVVLPDYFDALNRDFRYQLTVIGQFAQAIVGREIEDGRFVIKTDRPGVKVSWQVTGIRQDPYANAHRIRVEEVKPEKEQGYYLHPQLYGQPEEKSVEWARQPEMMQQLKQQREKGQAEKEKKSN